MLRIAMCLWLLIGFGVMPSIAFEGAEERPFESELLLESIESADGFEAAPLIQEESALPAVLEANPPFVEEVDSSLEFTPHVIDPVSADKKDSLQVEDTPLLIEEAPPSEEVFQMLPSIEPADVSGEEADGIYYQQEHIADDESAPIISAPLEDDYFDAPFTGETTDFEWLDKEAYADDFFRHDPFDGIDWDGFSANKQTKDRGALYWIERSHGTVSGFVKTVGLVTDEFFSREAATEENETFVRVRVGTVFERGGDVYLTQDIKAKMDLPTTRDKLQLLFDNDPDDVHSLPSQYSTVDRVRESKRNVDENSTATLRWIAPVWKNWRPNLDVGVRARVPLDPFVRLRFRRDFDVNENWDLRVSQEFSYYHSRAAGSDTGFTFIRFLRPYLMVSNNFDVRWRGKAKEMEYAFITGILYRVTDKDTLSWQIGTFYDWKPERALQSYNANFTYRRQLYWNWLYMELIPAVHFKRAYDFRDDHSFTARLEVTF